MYHRHGSDNGTDKTKMMKKSILDVDRDVYFR